MSGSLTSYAEPEPGLGYVFRLAYHRFRAALDEALEGLGLSAQGETHQIMTLDERIQAAEADLFHAVGAEVDESFLDLATTGVRVRLLAAGSGSPVVLLHGVSLSAAAWAPLFAALSGWRLL